MGGGGGWLLIRVLFCEGVAHVIRGRMGDGMGRLAFVLGCGGACWWVLWAERILNSLYCIFYGVEMGL